MIIKQGQLVYNLTEIIIIIIMFQINIITILKNQLIITIMILLIEKID
jgi:hypothetical protein